MNQGERKAIVIWNPQAGRGGARRGERVAEFCTQLTARGIAAEAQATGAPHEAAKLTMEAVRQQGATDVIVSGGDGTVNEALQGLMRANATARFGVWPNGTANVLARELKLPFNTKKLIDLIADGATRAVRVGCATNERTCEQRFFFLMAGIGLDASVVQHVNPKLKKRIGKAAFWYAGLGHLAHWQPQTFHLEVDGREYPATFAALGKSTRYGGDLAITPRASLEAPDFEICLINSQSRLRYLQLLTQAMREGGAFATARDVTFLHAKRARAVGSGVRVQADGEIIGELPMKFRVAQTSVRLLVPLEDGSKFQVQGSKNLKDCFSEN